MMVYIIRLFWMPAVEETRFLRWVHFDQPLEVKMDGRKKIGVVAWKGKE